ncbi:hypothetical protein PHLCEN_2v2812 [Hermanssonia centrifuga]|uniref:Uncharacterized protein n=1 Tax=Hermanssonia centrifuga TaxID=98765 RepID=A0A2R6RI07_9APHY|nr:hypothetical protein PHLCEN_2v2812 [Hermanssonia centrifuga]
MLPPVIPPIPSHTQIREFLPPRVDPTREHNKLSKPFLDRERGLQRVSSLSTISSTGKDSQKSSSSGKSSKQSGGSVVLPALAEEGQTTQIGGAAAYELFAMEELGELDECSLFLHMHRAAALVYAAKESMWDELMDMVARSDNALRRYGWKDEDYTEKATRNKFEALWERYKVDMRVRASLWYPMTHYGWSYPRQDPLTKAELADEDRLRQAILEARNYAKEEEIQPGLRSIRLLIGMKGS